MYSGRGLRQCTDTLIYRREKDKGPVSEWLAELIPEDACFSKVAKWRKLRLPSPSKVGGLRLMKYKCKRVYVIRKSGPISADCGTVDYFEMHRVCSPKILCIIAFMQYDIGFLVVKGTLGSGNLVPYDVLCNMTEILDCRTLMELSPRDHCQMEESSSLNLVRKTWITVSISIGPCRL